jgi:hypothetical protein
MPFRISGETALLRLTRDCKFEDWRALRILEIARDYQLKREPCPGGYVEVQCHGRVTRYRDETVFPDHYLFSVIENVGETPRRKVATGEIKDYTQGNTDPKPGRPGRAQSTSRRKEMPRGSRARTAPEPEVAEQNGDAEDFGKYLDKPLTATMEDYVTWFEANVARLEDVPVDKLLSLGSTLYPKFQKSDYNIQRREERAAAREPEPEPETRPARGSRSTAKPATGKPAGRSAAKSAGRSTTRGRTTAAAGTTPDAPF